MIIICCRLYCVPFIVSLRDIAYVNAVCIVLHYISLILTCNLLLFGYRVVLPVL